MSALPRTYHDGTATTEGFIPHRIVGDVHQPVRLDFPSILAPLTMRKAQAPMRDAAGELIFALPGGAA